MAGDWIKIQNVTPDKPEVFHVAEDLGIDPDAVVGKLVRIWIWADQQTYDGNARSVTLALLDRVAGVTGFAKAMQDCGWLVPAGDGKRGFIFPHFERHNGKSAKRRALTSIRVQVSRNAHSVTSALPEKRREEKRRVSKTPLPPNYELPPELDTVEFGNAWAEWEQHRREIKKKLTPMAAKRQINSLAKMGFSQAIAAIHFSIEKGYTGIFEAKSKGKNKLDQEEEVNKFLGNENVDKT